MTTTPISTLPETSSVIYTKGTLRYTPNQLYVLFFWLMWNEVTIYLIEQVTSFNGIFMRDQGASFTEIGLFGSIGRMISMWLNPWFSTWSDRHRGRMGRRRPFLFFATPPFVLFLIVMPYMPEFAQFVQGVPFGGWLLSSYPHERQIAFHRPVRFFLRLLGPGFSGRPFSKLPVPLSS